MNKLVEKELIKIAKDTGIPFNPDMREFVIPKSASKPSLDSLSVNTVYKIKIADYVINPPDTFSLANTWNNGTKPTLKEQKMVVVQILGKMVKVKSLDEEWTGWLPMKSIEQFSIIGGV